MSITSINMDSQYCSKNSEIVKFIENLVDLVPSTHYRKSHDKKNDFLSEILTGLTDEDVESFSAFMIQYINDNTFEEFVRLQAVISDYKCENDSITNLRKIVGRNSYKQRELDEIEDVIIERFSEQFKLIVSRIIDL